LTGAQTNYFTLASSLAGANTLPDDQVELDVRNEQGVFWFEGRVVGSGVFTRWQVECMRNGEPPAVIRSGEEQQGVKRLSFSYSLPLYGKQVFRVVLSNPDGYTLYGKWVVSQPSTERGITMQVFPNPAGRRLFIKVDAAVRGPLVLRVMGIDGKEYHSSRTEVREGLNTKDITLPSLLPGLYFVSAALNGNYRMTSILIRQ
jgi:hypothetical protein